MSTYGGEKRRRSIRYQFNQTQYSPLNKVSIQEESILTTNIDGQSSFNTFYDQNNSRLN
jgi:hypothetical protein